MEKKYTNENNIYRPEFIPFYLEEVNKYGLTLMEGLIYGFIRFYTKTGNKFYFKSKDFANIVGSTENMINKTLKKLEDKGLIIRETKNIGFKRIRFVKVNTEPNRGVSMNLTHRLGSELGEELVKKEYNKKEYLNKNKDIYTENKKNSLEKKLDEYIKEIIPEHKQEQFKEIIKEFIEYRKEIKKPLTPIALKKAIKKIKELSSVIPKLAQQICDQTIEKGWTTFYPLPEDYQEKNKKKQEEKKIAASKIVENENYKHSGASAFGKMLAGQLGDL